jgi:hypothetical protein
MSLPKSKVLSVSKGVMTNASLRYASPKQSQSVIVNVTPSGETQIKNENELIEDQPPTVQTGFVSYGESPYANLELPTSVEEYQNILLHKDQELKALNLIIEIIKSNPLIINKFIISHYESLLELIKLLTHADDVEFTERDIDVGCICSCDDKLFNIEKVFVRKNNNVYNLKYSFPNVIQLLETHRISIKIVKMS